MKTRFLFPSSLCPRTASLPRSSEIENFYTHVNLGPIILRVSAWAEFSVFYHCLNKEALLGIFSLGAFSFT